MFIYKITNIQNNKVYIGQTIRPIKDRFNRHINDAVSNRLDTHLARAIRLYGSESFVVEQIDTATSQQELTEKEQYWIHFYNSVQAGYNETDDCLKCGGNTYKSKTKEEMQIIKNKLSESKKGGKNPNSHKVKCKSILTKEEHIFDSLAEMAAFFNTSNHSFITSRCTGKITCLYKKEWMIAYAENDYNSMTVEKGNHRAKQIVVTDLKTNETKQFESYAAAERYYQIPCKGFSNNAYKHSQDDYFICYNRYKIKILK